MVSERITHNTNALPHKRLEKEYATIHAMISIYCRDHHRESPHGLCSGCAEMLRYAHKKLLNCPFAEEKPTCGNCTVHCYKKEMRQKVKEIMRYAGPKMAYRHPLKALQHLLDSRRKPIPLAKVKKNIR